MTLLADGTLTVKTDRLDSLGVARRGASLPSSSNNQKPAARPSPVVPEGEGATRAPEPVGDTLTLSSVVQAKAEKAARATPDSTESQDPKLQEQTSSVTAEQADTDQEKVSEDESLDKVAEDIAQKLSEDESLSLRFSQDEETGAELFQVVEKETGDVVRQVPAEEILQFMKKFKSVSGLLFSEQA